MKADIHPDYREVVFQDVTSDFKFLTRSTLGASSRETIKWEDGNEYPLVKIEVSSATHPFYTEFLARFGLRPEVVALVQRLERDELDHQRQFSAHPCHRLIES